MSDENNEEQSSQAIKTGTASITPSTPVVAGCHTTIEYVYTAEHPIDETGGVRIAFRCAGDFGTPQFERPEEENYCFVATSGDCRVEVRWDPKGNTIPWGKTLYLKVVSGCLAKGDTVTVLFGDQSKGSKGWRIQTFCEDSFEFKTYVDSIATNEFKELEVSPTLKIIPGKPVKAVCIAPSIVKRGEDFDYFVKLEDRWGNPVNKAWRLKHPKFKALSVQYIEFEDSTTGFKATSNPIKVVEELPEMNFFWADFHGQSEETIGSNTIVDYYAFARDSGCLDVGAHHGNDFQITDEFRKILNQVADDFNEDGRFVTFPDIEVAVEIHSGRGTFEWLLEDALNRKCRVGICANSDGNKGCPGASYPGPDRLGSYGGLTCVMAPKLDRENITEAIKKRHFYATTGNRPIMDVSFRIDDKKAAVIGDVVNVATGAMSLHGRLMGTAPIDRVEIYNGMEIFETLTPYSQEDLGRRIKIAWSGAEEKGRARLTNWDGSFTLIDNAIKSIQAVNFWNPDRPMRRLDDQHVEWASATNGGLAGCIVELERDGGKIEISTTQGDYQDELANVGYDPITLEYEGIAKTLSLYRLPARKDSLYYEFEIELRMEDLRDGDNPIFVKLIQEDGHMAWTSPIYLVQEASL